MDKYKKERENVVQALRDLGVPESEIPEGPEFDEVADIEGDDEEMREKDEKARKNVPVDKMSKLQQLYDNVECMKYGLEKGNQTTVVQNAKPVIADVPPVSQQLVAEGNKTKDVKKKKAGENMGKDYVPAVNDSTASLKDKENEGKKQQALESCDKLQQDIVDALASEGISKNGSKRILEEKERQDDMIPDLVKLKQDAVDMEDSVDNHKSNDFVKDAKQTMADHKAVVGKLREKATEKKDPMLNAYANELDAQLPKAVNASKASIQDPKNDEKNKEADKEIDDYISVIDDALKHCKATPEEMKVEKTEKPDSEIVKKTKKCRKDVDKSKEALIDGDMEELADDVVALDEDQADLLKEMNEEAKKNGNKQLEALAKKAETEYNEAFEAIKKAKKNPNDAEARQNAEDALNKYDDTLAEILEEEGKPVSETEKSKKKLLDDLNKVQSGLENKDMDKVKEGNKEMNKDVETLKKNAEDEGEDLFDLCACAKDAQTQSIASARDPKNAEKKKKAFDAIEKCKDALRSKDDEDDKEAPETKEGSLSFQSSF